MYGSQTPIDIHCSKLVDWLVQRRHCQKDWGENLGQIRRKIRAALRDMPENEDIKRLLIGSKLDYFKSKRIVEILQTTEADTKNFFGYYSSQRMKDWQDIVKSYERDCIYLAEIATDLIRETNYEVPGIRKVINKLKQEKDEKEKERANLLRRAQQFSSEHQKIAQSYGITGVNVEQELYDKSKCLVDVMGEIVGLSKTLEAPMNYYRDYSSNTTSLECAKFLAMLEYVITKGNTTVYEWKHGVAPERIDLPSQMPGNSVCSGTSEIELIDDEIDFGEDPPSSESSSGFVHVKNADDNAGNIAIVEDTFIQVMEESGTILDMNVSQDKVAQNDDAYLVLEQRKTRSQFVNNLYELEAFFQQLKSDLDQPDSRSTSAFAIDSNSRTRCYELAELSEISFLIRQILNIFNREDNKILFQMKDSPSFVDSVKDKIIKKAKQASDCAIKAEFLAIDIEDLKRQISETEIQLKKSIRSTKELQDQVEQSLRELYTGRPINIMGCVSQAATGQA